jgi:hypothetical protein
MDGLSAKSGLDLSPTCAGADKGVVTLHGLFSAMRRCPRTGDMCYLASNMNSPNVHAAGLHENTIAAQQACIDHARDLLSSARAVQAVGHHNIAYHLALALEELGRRELIGVESISRLAMIPPAWPAKHTQDHVKKLFWCFFGGGFFFGADHKTKPRRNDRNSPEDS